MDSLAVAIGTKHGAYKFDGDSKLRFDILKQIENAIPNTPLVLHGASGVNQKTVKKLYDLGVDITGAKGVSDDCLKEACQMNICKINCDTDLRMSFLQGILNNVNTNKKNIDYRKYLTEGMNEVKTLVENKIMLFGGLNKAL